MPSTLKSIDLGIAEALESDPTFRSEYLRAWAQTQVANQLRQMRQRRNLRQREVALRSGTGQSAISRIEKADYEGWTFKTLLKIAEALDARLEVSLTPIETVAASYAQHKQQDAADADTGFVGSFSAGTLSIVGHFDDDVSEVTDGHDALVSTSLDTNASYQEA